MVLDIQTETPEALLFLFEPHMFKVIYGGRDGCKSWAVARALLMMGTQRPIRILCTRETQQSIQESVHQLLSEQIKALGLELWYEVLQYTIRGRNGTEFIFAGLRRASVAELKSYESVDIAWVEEAQVVSKHSWEVLLPTIRKSGSEIWITFNPELATDETYRRWVVSPPPGAVVVKTGYEDNAWLSAESRAKIAYLKETDPRTFEHIYGGYPRTTVEGAIYEAELNEADQKGRIARVPYDATRPVDTFWDLGYADMVSIWFAQAFPFEYRIIDYEQDTHKALDWYVQRMQARAYSYGTCVLPWDGGAKSLGSGRSIEELLRAHGFKTRVLRQTSVHDGINAVRTLFPQFYWDGEKCSDGLAALRRYQWGPGAANGTLKREPLHDSASHPADALRTLAMSITVEETPRAEWHERPYYGGSGADGWMAG